MLSQNPAVWRELGRRVYARRLELGMHTQRDLAQKADVALNTVGRIEGGKVATRRSPSWPHLEIALQWEAGYISTLVEGLEPDRDVVLAHPDPELKREVIGLLVDGLPDSTGAEITAIYEELNAVYLDLGWRPQLVIAAGEEGDALPFDA